MRTLNTWAGLLLTLVIGYQAQAVPLGGGPCPFYANYNFNGPAPAGLRVAFGLTEPAPDANIAAGSECLAYLLTGINIRGPLDFGFFQPPVVGRPAVVSDALTLRNVGGNVEICAASDPFTGGATSTVDCPLVADVNPINEDAFGTFFLQLVPATDGRALFVEFCSDGEDSRCLPPVTGTFSDYLIILVVPEPSTWLLLAIGAITLIGYNGRRTNQTM